MYAQTMTAPPTEQRPTEAFVLSLIGGIIIALGGVGIMTLGTFFGGLLFGGTFLVVGALGILDGAVICIASVMLHANPGQKEIWGILIIVLSVLSWIVAFGGFFIGFLLGLIGGILALTWVPEAPKVVWVGGPLTVYPQPLPSYLPPPPPPPLRVCLSCGRQIDHSAKFCQACGKPVPP